MSSRICAAAASAAEHVGHGRTGDASVSGFVFKVQANMDPNHRDRIAFMRLCSGRFRRGMRLTQVRGPARR